MALNFSFKNTPHHFSFLRVVRGFETNKSGGGFTLIELLVVIAIIGLLSAIVLVSTQGLRQKAKITKGLEFSQGVFNALGAYAVGWWSFEEGSGGSVADASGYGNNGTWSGSGIHWTGDNPDVPQIGKAGQFNGTNDYLDCGGSNSLQNISTITFEAWIKPDGDATGYHNIIAKRWSHPFAFFIYPPNALYIYFKWSDGTTGSYWQNNAITPGAWQYVVGTYDSTSIVGYLNGEVIIGPTSVGKNIQWVAPFLKVYIGGDEDGKRFNGLIDEVRIYETALTLGEIQQHYVEGLEEYKLAQQY